MDAYVEVRLPLYPNTSGNLPSYQARWEVEDQNESYGVYLGLDKEALYVLHGPTIHAGRFTLLRVPMPELVALIDQAIREKEQAS